MQCRRNQTPCMFRTYIKSNGTLYDRISHAAQVYVPVAEATTGIFVSLPQVLYFETQKSVNPLTFLPIKFPIWILYRELPLFGWVHIPGLAHCSPVVISSLLPQNITSIHDTVAYTDTQTDIHVETHIMNPNVQNDFQYIDARLFTTF